MSTTEHDERLVAELREELDYVEEELVQMENDVRGARSVSWATAPLSIVAIAIAAAAIVVAAVVARDGGSTTTVATPATHASHAAPAAAAAAAAKVAFEPYRTPDPALPAVPAGKVKKFRVEVFQHVTKVAADKPPTQVWSFGINGKLYRGTGASTPIVVNQGDRVQLTLVNGGRSRWA